uniref:Uncharacterized protein n=1 Tax=Sus scrofa TaxID=9823 RepID=A0A8D0UV37_PIG
MRKSPRLMNEIRELNRWRNIPCSWIRRLSTVKMLVHSNFIYRFTANPIKIPGSYFVDTDRLILKFKQSVKKLKTANTILKNKGGLALFDFHNYYKATVIKTMGISKRIDK